MKSPLAACTVLVAVSSFVMAKIRWMDTVCGYAFLYCEGKDTDLSRRSQS
jgi:hypothetical protein